MLSRVLRAGAGARVERLVWPGAGAPPGNCRATETATSADITQARLAQIEEQTRRQVGEARQAGYRDGETAGKRLAAAEIQPLIERLARTIEEIAALRPRLMREAEAELLELALAIARRILHREISVDPSALAGLVKAALEKLAAQEIQRIRIHPELEPALRRALQEEGRGGLEVLADATVEPGGLRFETARGQLDSSIETQLAEIGRGLADRLPEN
jgi:flagellar assembly protein FliH